MQYPILLPSAARVEMYLFLTGRLVGPVLLLTASSKTSKLFHTQHTDCLGCSKHEKRELADTLLGY